ncbi:15616_t:CDS:1, partial [Cetraspora pellucida]
ITEKNPAAYVALTAEVDVQLSTMQINTSLTNSEKKIAEKILFNNYHIFAKNISEEGQTLELGQTNKVCHEIYTPDAHPIKQRAYKASPDDQEFI